MKSLIAPLAGLGMLAAAVGAALAAPPEYCALYAREYANQFAEAAGEKPGSEPKIQDEAYYRCLNLDQEPAMPRDSAYFGTSVDTAGKGGQAGTSGDTPPASVADAPSAADAAQPASSDTPLASGDISPSGAGDPTPTAAATSHKPPTKTADNGPIKHSYTSEEQPWTPGWVKWCKDHYPHSFNEKDGTIVPFGTTKRQMCK